VSRLPFSYRIHIVRSFDRVTRHAHLSVMTRLLENLHALADEIVSIVALRSKRLLMTSLACVNFSLIAISSDLALKHLEEGVLEFFIVTVENLFDTQPSQTRFV